MPSFFDTVPNDIIPSITKHLLDDQSYERFAFQTSKQLAEKIRAAKESCPLFDIFSEQHLINWKALNNKQRFKAAIKLLDQPENIQKLLGLINNWMQTKSGKKRFYAWIDTFRVHFLELYKTLAQPTSLEHYALFALITPDVQALDLTQLKLNFESIATDYTVIAQSLQNTHEFLTHWKISNLLSSTQTDVSWNLQGAQLQGNFFFNVYIGLVNLQNTNLRGTHLRGAILRRATLRGADLREADLQVANLRGADLRGADLRGADLRGADLRGADLRGADLRGANISQANFGGANLQNAIIDKTIILDFTNFIDANIKGVQWLNIDLSSLKERSLKLLKEKISFADLNQLLSIYEKNKNGILFVQQNPNWDSFRSLFFQSASITTHGELFNQAILNRIISLQKISSENNESLQKLKTILNPTASAMLRLG